MSEAAPLPKARGSRVRVALEALVLAALLGLGLEAGRAAHGIDGGLIAVALLLGSALLRDGLAFVRAEPAPPLALRVFELAAAASLVLRAPLGPVIALAALPALARAVVPGLARTPDRRATALEEIALAGLALAVLAWTWHVERFGLELALAVALAGESWLRGAPREASALHSRLAAFALVGASASLRAIYEPGPEATVLAAFAALPALRAIRALARRLESPPRHAPEPASSVARLALGVALLHLARRGPGPALVVGYMLALVVALAHAVPNALGKPRLARRATRAVLLLAIALLFAPRDYRPAVSTTLVPVPFASAHTRAWYELAPPAGWAGRGETFAYVFLEGSRDEVVAAQPILTVEGRELPLEVGPAREPPLPTTVRAPLPPDLLARATLRFAFGFGNPSPRVGIHFVNLDRSSLDRSPSVLGPDAPPPPPGAPLVRRERGLLAWLAGAGPFEEPEVDLGPLGKRRGRFSIDLWLLAPDGTVLATSY